MSECVRGIPCIPSSGPHRVCPAAACSLRDHTLARRVLIAPTVRGRPIRFSDYLKDQNRRGAAVSTLTFDDYLKAHNRAERASERRSAPHGAMFCRSRPEAAPERRECPSPAGLQHHQPLPITDRPGTTLPELPPIPATAIERRIQIIYNVELPVRPGRVIDVLT